MVRSRRHGPQLPTLTPVPEDESLSDPSPKNWRRFVTTTPSRKAWMSLALALPALYGLLYLYFEVILGTREWHFEADDLTQISEHMLQLYDYSETEKLGLKTLKQECVAKSQLRKVDVNARVRYYLNDWAKYFDKNWTFDAKAEVNLDVNIERPSDETVIPVDHPFCFHSEFWFKHESSGLHKFEFNPGATYRRDFLRMTYHSNTEKTPYVVSIGDGSINAKNFPLLGKTRNREDKNTVVVKIETIRHFRSISSIFADDTLTFEAKKDAAVWRGVTTGFGRGQRAAILSRLAELQQSSILDVGYNRVVQGAEVPREQYRRAMSRKMLLTYKMIIIAEGNDVSTGLKWALLSTSAVLMPEPTIISWLMEDQLVPWEHYIPVNQDFSDLEEKAKWCLAHVEECKAVAMNGRCYMQRFLDKTEEDLVEEILMHSVEKMYKAKNLDRLCPSTSS